MMRYLLTITLALLAFATVCVAAQGEAPAGEPAGSAATNTEHSREADSQGESESLPDTTFRPSERIRAGQAVAFPEGI